MRSLKKLAKAIVLGSVEAGLTPKQVDVLLSWVSGACDSKTYFLDTAGKYYWEEVRKGTVKIDE